MFLLHHPRSMGQRVLVHHVVKRRNLQRRPFFSFLAPNDNSHSKQLSKEEIDRLQREEQILTDETHYRMSLQHAHPLGPWQAILAAVKSHFQTQQPFRVLRLHRACDTKCSCSLYGLLSHSTGGGGRCRQYYHCYGQCQKSRRKGHNDKRRKKLPTSAEELNQISLGFDRS